MPLWPVQAGAEAWHDRYGSTGLACSLELECTAAGLGRRPSQAAGYLLAKASEAGENQDVEHLSRECLEAGLGQIRDSPHDGGRLVLIVRRPAVGERALPAEAVLDQVAGLDGDNWLTRGSTSTPDGSADRQRQVTVMNARVAELVAGGTGRMLLAGDQLQSLLGPQPRQPPGRGPARGRPGCAASQRGPALGLREVRRALRG